MTRLYAEPGLLYPWMQSRSMTKIDTFEIELQPSSMMLQIQMGHVKSLNADGAIFKKMCQSFVDLFHKLLL